MQAYSAHFVNEVIKVSSSEFNVHKLLVAVVVFNKIFGKIDLLFFASHHQQLQSK